jgi:DNA polymerase IIIc chi subunit
MSFIRPEVIFYILPSSDRFLLYRFCYKLCKKILKKNQNHHVCIHTNDDNDLTQLEKLFYQDSSEVLLPAMNISEIKSYGIQTSLIMGNLNDLTFSLIFNDILIRLNGDMNQLFNFNRIIELVDQSDEQLIRARKQYRYYRSKKFQIRTHKL